MMIRFAIALLAVAAMGQCSFAQLFPNAPWNKFQQAAADPCADGQCANGQCEHTAPTLARVPLRVTIVVAPVAPVASYSVVSTAPVARSGGSSGGFAVGSLDAYGHVITSIGTSVASDQASAEAIQPLAIGDRVKFRRALLDAARKSRENGEITAGQFFLLSAASRNPAVIEKMMAAVHEAAIEEGLATTQAIDWGNLIAFIEKLIPIIIQLIELFS